MVRTLVVAVALVFTGGCLSSDLVPCGELSCAAGDVCTPGGCASPGDVAACDGLADGTTCKAMLGGAGTCVGGSCQTGLCGNGRVDPGEVCDLGAVNGTCAGCSANCQSNETCGNGIVDEECGETCDDQNANAADGCELCKLTSWNATAVIGGNLGATTVGLTISLGVAVDRDGNVYIADTYNHRIRRVDSSGFITILAGTGTSGYSGDGGAATSAQLDAPCGVAIDGLGNVYIADTSNHRVRRVDAAGVMTTLAGTGTSGSSGDGGAATSAQLDSPSGVAVDGLGNVYIADTSNHRIRRVDGSGVITTLAGIGTLGYSGDGGAATSAQLADPFGVAVDGLGNVYIADSGNNRVRRVDAAGVITTLAGTRTRGGSGDGGAATSAQLADPFGVAVDGLGNVYIADFGNNRVRRVDAAGVITTLAGIGTLGYGGDGGAATSAQLDEPSGVAVDGLGNVYVADSENHRIRWVDAVGVITTLAGTGNDGDTGDGGAATSAQLNFPNGVAVDGLGNVYIADTYNSRIRRVDSSGVITTVAGAGTYGYSGDGGAATSAQLAHPYGVAVDGLGDVYIADSGNSRIRRVDGAGVITTLAGTGTSGDSGDGGAATSAQLANPSGVAVDRHGNVYIADSGNNRIRRVDGAGVITTIAGNGTYAFGGDGGAATSAELDEPSGVAVDGLGNVYIADSINERIRRVDVAGVITTLAGTGTSGYSGYSGDGGAATSAQLAYPSSVAVDGLGNVYIADSGNNRMRRVDSGGVITTLAGTGGSSDNGDGGAANGAQLGQPSGVAIDGLGNVYIADGNNRIRRVDAAGVIITVAGPIDPRGMGPLAQADLADPRAFTIGPAFTLFAGGSSGTVQAARVAPMRLDAVAGRYPQSTATGALARFRDQSFGTVDGVAYDAAAGVIYVTESSANRIHVVTIVDPNNADTWTIAPLAGAAGTAGFADGAAATAQFRDPTGLYFDPLARQLYVADTGNHVIRAIDLATSTVRTVAGVPATLGYFGDGGAATGALLYEPQAMTLCTNGDVFIADTGNHRVRRVAAGTHVISTVLGDGTAASSGEGTPASTFPVNAPLGLACDAIGNLYVTSTTAVRLVLADANGIVDGTGVVQTIYGAPPRTVFPASVTSCLTGLAVVDAMTVEVVDSCTGLLVEFHRQPR